MLCLSTNTCCCVVAANKHLLLHRVPVPSCQQPTKEAELRERDWGEDPTPLVRLLQASVKAGMAAAIAGAAAGGSLREEMDMGA